MKKLSLLIFVFFLTLSSSNAQEYVFGMEEYINYSNVIHTNVDANFKYSEMNGTPFLTEEFQEGMVKLNNGKIYKGFLRYDIYSDQIEFKTEKEEVYEIKNPESVKKLSIGEDNFLCFTKEEGRQLDGIYQELANGELTLLEKHRVYLKDEVPAKPYVEPKPAEFIKKKSTFWVINSDGKVVPLGGKKDALALDAERGDEISSFIKKNKLRLGEKNDIVELIDYLNNSK